MAAAFAVVVTSEAGIQSMHPKAAAALDPQVQADTSFLVVVVDTVLAVVDVGDIAAVVAVEDKVHVVVRKGRVPM